MTSNDVYLDGGPGVGVPQGAAGLDDGTYVFQVTDPSGKTLLSTDFARCRQFVVSGGVINGVVDNDCEHPTGIDVDHSAVTVQLMPFLDTPNPGGEYKVWVTRLEDFLPGCQELGKVGDTGLDVVNCGNAPANRHGFILSHSKTDNFKVADLDVREIDTRFFDSNGNILDGRGVTWTDIHGAKNTKWSYWKPERQIFHEAHVEAPEVGTHHITIEDQPDCMVDHVLLEGVEQGPGPQTVAVRVRPRDKNRTWFIDVHCLP
jgi:hypothetical protein